MENRTGTGSSLEPLSASALRLYDRAGLFAAHRWYGAAPTPESSHWNCALRLTTPLLQPFAWLCSLARALKRTSTVRRSPRIASRGALPDRALRIISERADGPSVWSVPQASAWKGVRPEERRPIATMAEAPHAPPSVASEVSHLFRTRRVSEIRTIESSVRQEAEERAANLRNMLGTRYGDLLTAADAVRDARDAAQKEVHDALQGLAGSANKLRTGFLARSRSSSATSQVPEVERRRETSALGAKLLHIVDSPELLYAYLESAQIHDAMVRFKASERAYAELDKGVAPGFVSTRWRQVEVFRDQILDAAEGRLTQQGLSNDEYAGLFASAVVMAPSRNPVDVVSSFLSVRLKWMETSLSSVRDDTTPSSIVDAIRRCALVVRDVVNCCATLFENPERKALALLSNADTDLANSFASVVDDGAVARAVATWMESVDGIVRGGGASLVASCASARELSQCLVEVDEVFQTSEWVAARDGAFKLGKDAGCDVFREILGAQAVVLISSRVEDTVTETIAKLDDAGTNTPHIGSSGDTMWTTMSPRVPPLDTTQEDTAVDHGGAELVREVLLAGPSRLVVSHLESALRDTMADVDLLGVSLPSVSKTFREAAVSMVPRVADELLQRGRRMNPSRSVAGSTVPTESSPRPAPSCARTYFDSANPAIEETLFVARTAVALRLVEHVPKAFTYGLQCEPDDSSNPELDKFLRTAGEASALAYAAWARHVCDQFASQLSVELRSVFSLESRAQPNIACDDSESPYPSCPSPGAFRVNMAACRAANSAGGFALSSQAVRALNTAMATTTSEVYDKVISEFEAECDKTQDKSRAFGHENVYFQYLFDVEFLSAMLLGERRSSSKNTPNREEGMGTSAVHDKELDARFDSLRQRLRSKVDPINLAAAKTGLDEAVADYITRSAVLLGSVSGSPTAEIGRSAAAGAGASASRVASVLATARPVPRFAYLPAPMPSTHALRGGLGSNLTGRTTVRARTEAEGGRETDAKTRDTENTVVEYASKLTENVGRFGTRFFETFRGVS